MTSLSFSAKSPSIMLTGSSRPFSKTSGLHARRQGFSLIEILVVLSIASLLSYLVTVGMQSVLGSAFSNQTSDLSNILIRARAYAMAKNTYVFVGIEEVDASQPTTAVQNPGVGRVGVTVLASNDGTRNNASSNLTVVSPLRRFDNMHLAASSGVPSANLPNNSTTGTGATYNLSSSSLISATPFTWPVSGTALYSFGNNTSSPGSVIQFDPQGEAQIITTSSGAQSILQWIELDLVPTHGTSTSGTSSKDPATILIDGASGSVTTYRN